MYSSPQCSKFKIFLNAVPKYLPFILLSLELISHLNIYFLVYINNWLILNLVNFLSSLVTSDRFLVNPYLENIHFNNTSISYLSWKTHKTETERDKSKVKYILL